MGRPKSPHIRRCGSERRCSQSVSIFGGSVGLWRSGRGCTQLKWCNILRAAAKNSHYAIRDAPTFLRTPCASSAAIVLESWSLRWLMFRINYTSLPANIEGQLHPFLGDYYRRFIMSKRKTYFEKNVWVVTIDKRNDPMAFKNSSFYFRDNVACEMLQIEPFADKITRFRRFTEPDLEFVKEFFSEWHSHEQPWFALCSRAELNDISVGSLLESLVLRALWHTHRVLLGSPE